jgi:uncharacterized protein (DUF1330 family)
MISKVKVCLCLIFLFAATASGAGEKTYILDFVSLNEGVHLSDRDQYDHSVIPIVKKYGMKLKGRFDLDAIAGSFTQPARLNVWELDSLESMQKIGQDEQYASLKSMRDSIHDMQALTLYVADFKTRRKLEKGLVLVDLVVMNEGFGKDDRNSYEAKVLPIAEDYGMRVVQSFDILKKMRGSGPSAAMRLNLWSIEDPEKMKKLSQDERYTSLIEYRNKIHDMDNVSLFFSEVK